MLRCFELALGLCINLNKSKLYKVNLYDSLLQELSIFLACEIGKLHLLFLGILLEANHIRKETWYFVLSKLHKRLGFWSVKYLSLGGKVTLLNSVFNNILIYILYFFKAPKGILEKIIKIQKEFMWGKGDDRGEVGWVSWERICISKN